MKTYTIELVTFIPFVQTVSVQAENQYDAINAAYNNVDDSAWARDEDHVIEQDDIDVENLDPEDELVEA